MEKTLAYTAGYIEGDGCFHIGKSISPIKYHMRITVTSANREILDFFKSLYGGAVRLTNKLSRRGNEKFCFQWTVIGEKSFQLTKDLIPFLNEKREQAETCIRFFTEKDKKVKDMLVKDMRNLKSSRNKVTDCIVKEIRSIRKTKILSEIDFAYFAGFIDSECCLTINKYRSKETGNLLFKACLQCTSTTYPMFLWIAENIGGSFHFRSITKEKRNNEIQWRFSSKRLHSILPNLILFLRHKRPVAEKMMDFFKTTCTNGGDRQSLSFKERYAKILSVRSDIVRDIHQLNSKGFLIT